MSSLIVITGPMYASKTTELLALLRRETFAKKKVILFKPQIDQRYAEEKVVTHDGVTMDSLICSTGTPLLVKYLYEIDKYDVIGIDEIQFFDPSITTDVLSLCLAGKKVIVSGLNLDANGQPFEIVQRLMHDADILKKLTAICHSCGEEAIYTKKLTPLTEQITVGGVEDYEASCRNCFML